MVGESFVLGVVTLVGVVAFVYGILSVSSQGQILHGVRKRFFCDGKQQVVDVDFVEVNRNKYDVASCTAFVEDQNISCDKHCVKILEEDVSQADGKGKVLNQVRAPQPAFPGDGR